MNRTVVIASVSIILVGCAMAAGWLHYQAQPQGDLFYTPITRCDTRSHSFSSAFLLTLVAEGLACLVLAAASISASFLPRCSSAKPTLAGIAKSALLVTAVLAASSMLHPIFEAQLPLHIQAECLQNSR